MEEDDAASLSAFRGGEGRAQLTSRESFESAMNPSGAGRGSRKGAAAAAMLGAGSRVLESDREGDLSEGSAGRELSLFRYRSAEGGTEHRS
jgi:hypothetical protein